MDESTDIAGESHAAICVSYDDPKTGRLRDEFFALPKLTSWTGANLFEALVRAFRARGVELEEKLASFSGDGCAAVASEKKGVFGYLRRKINSFCFGVHCAAHRAALAVKDAGTRNVSAALKTAVNRADITFRKAHRIFCKSAKRREDYKGLADVFQCTVRTPKLFTPSRSVPGFRANAS
ncbi:hypothetical protein GPECTOR_12g419 [Gonium pectorale]|uniref:DUF4371 domain-containing protein n=1 Tax=Gonium pectorale TaxID=33097 RepID=A0A150GNM1_GONPE|nr:hypothetical protein GPECTOR_12g419 [Gonium pectorale]|eukprot:KXZ51456.1 hypothetical protein GPECTOR_12g419 [Gonium pectorale]